MENRIDYYRKRKGLTLEALAKKIGTRREYLSALKSGTRQLNEKWLKRLSQALDCRPADLLAEMSGMSDVANDTALSSGKGGYSELDMIVDSESLAEDILNHHGVVDITSSQRQELQNHILRAIQKRRKVISLHTASLILEKILGKKP